MVSLECMLVISWILENKSLCNLENEFELSSVESVPEVQPNENQKNNDKNRRLTECPSKVTSERNFGTELSSRMVKYTLLWGQIFLTHELLCTTMDGPSKILCGQNFLTHELLRVMMDGPSEILCGQNFSTHKSLLVWGFRDTWEFFFCEGRIYGILFFVIDESRYRWILRSKFRNRQISRLTNLGFDKSSDQFCDRQISQSRSLGIKEFCDWYFSQIGKLVSQEFWFRESLDPKKKNNEVPPQRPVGEPWSALLEVYVWEYPPSGPEEDECLLTKNQHFTVPVVLVEMGTLLKLARVSMLLVGRMWNTKKDHEYA